MIESLSEPDVDGWRSWQDREAAVALVDEFEAWFEANGRLTLPLRDYLRGLKATMMAWSLPADRAIGIERQSREARVSSMPFEMYEEDLLNQGGAREALRAQWGWAWFLENLVWLCAEGLAADVVLRLGTLLNAHGTEQPADMAIP